MFWILVTPRKINFSYLLLFSIASAFIAAITSAFFFIIVSTPSLSFITKAIAFLIRTTLTNPFASSYNKVRYILYSVSTLSRKYPLNLRKILLSYLGIYSIDTTLPTFFSSYWSYSWKFFLRTYVYNIAVFAVSSCNWSPLPLGFLLLFFLGPLSIGALLFSLVLVSSSFLLVPTSSLSGSVLSLIYPTTPISRFIRLIVLDTIKKTYFIVAPSFILARRSIF